MRPLWGGTTMCFWSSRYRLCMGSHYSIRDRSRRNYVWLTAPINCPNINYSSTVHTRKYTPVKYMILSFIAFIRHNLYVQIKQIGTHQNTMFRNIQALFDMSQRSHTFIAYYYTLSNAIRRSTIYSDRFPYSRNYSSN